MKGPRGDAAEIGLTNRCLACLAYEVRMMIYPTRPVPFDDTDNSLRGRSIATTSMLLPSWHAVELWRQAFKSYTISIQHFLLSMRIAINPSLGVLLIEATEAENVPCQYYRTESNGLCCGVSTIRLRVGIQ